MSELSDSPQSKIAGPVRAWLDRFAACVRERDFDGARAMFTSDVVSFGSWTGRMDELDALVASQWMQVWPRTSEFQFDLDHAAGSASVEGDIAWAAVTWVSKALAADGQPAFTRAGRATFVFRHADGRLLAIHSHFSLNPTARL